MTPDGSGMETRKPGIDYLEKKGLARGGADRRSTIHFRKTAIPNGGARIRVTMDECKRLADAYKFVSGRAAQVVFSVLYGEHVIDSEAVEGRLCEFLGEPL